MTRTGTAPADRTREVTDRAASYGLPLHSPIHVASGWEAIFSSSAASAGRVDRHSATCRAIVLLLSTKSFAPASGLPKLAIVAAPELDEVWPDVAGPTSRPVRLGATGESPQATRAARTVTIRPSRTVRSIFFPSWSSVMVLR